jgi:uncharacterized membrane protein YoaK (UPF0700 family)
LRVRANRERLRTLLLLLSAFFVGGVIGALGFQRFGYIATVPLAAVLLVLALIPVVDDLRRTGANAAIRDGAE